jgi:hypothetical protein
VPDGQPYRIGKLSTSDMGSGWGVELTWSGMTKDEKEDFSGWLKERAERLSGKRKIGMEEYEARKEKYGVNQVWWK